MIRPDNGDIARHCVSHLHGFPPGLPSGQCGR
jgi:hypothetical protein